LSVATQLSANDTPGKAYKPRSSLQTYPSPSAALCRQRGAITDNVSQGSEHAAQQQGTAASKGEVAWQEQCCVGVTTQLSADSAPDKTAELHSPLHSDPSPTGTLRRHRRAMTFSQDALNDAQAQCCSCPAPCRPPSPVCSDQPGQPPPVAPSRQRLARGAPGGCCRVGAHGATGPHQTPAAAHSATALQGRGCLAQHALRALLLLLLLHTAAGGKARQRTHMSGVQAVNECAGAPVMRRRHSQHFQAGTYACQQALIDAAKPLRQYTTQLPMSAHDQPASQLHAALTRPAPAALAASRGGSCPAISDASSACLCPQLLHTTSLGGPPVPPTCA
jgi:hypothetical protein